MYLAHTRPDLAYALSVVSQYMHNPGEQHMNEIMRILGYLKNAPGKGILFAKNVDHQSIEVYTDVDWAGAVDDRRSTSGYFTFVGGNLVTWKSKKQNIVTRSSVEAEFRDNVSLQAMFHKSGDILSCKVVVTGDGKSKGYGFVQFESKEYANATIEKLNGFIIDGK
ncbi:hypothetical protein VitviT2T_018894 [Vitis vinifera]|uniref:RRM domain-containing protein n=1 Tax=Vitis vinifera TaxID=29760 RepID=A0ABY9D1W6_VITVI|nr:hypothetical protein VitviT2T_018894 [Vitis vinifera]